MREQQEIIYELEQELESLDEIYAAGDEAQTHINYLCSKKNQHLMQYYHLKDDPVQLHYEVAMRIRTLLDLIDMYSDLNFN
jgi:hypothetical protein